MITYVGILKIYDSIQTVQANLQTAFCYQLLLSTKSTWSDKKRQNSKESKRKNKGIWLWKPKQNQEGVDKEIKAKIPYQKFERKGRENGTSRHHADRKIII